MGVPTRIGVHGGAWAVVALLSAAAGMVAAGVAPLVERTDDEALRLMVEAAPSYLDRDLMFVRRAEGALTPMAEATALPDQLPAPLREVTEVVWGFQRTTVAWTDGVGASLVGPGVTTEPDGLPPVISFHAQTGLDRETLMVSGRPPATRAGTGVVEVMVAAEVAHVLRVQTAGEYVAVPQGRPGRDVPVRVSGVFAARDAAAPVWQAEPLLLETALTSVGEGPNPPMAVRAVLVTDEAGMAVLARPDLIRNLEPQTGTRMRLDAALLDRGWAAAAPAAVATAHTDPRLRDWDLTTRLPQLLATYAGRQRSSHALTAVVVGGTGGVLLGLLVLAGWLLADRRRLELALLRARGGSAGRVAGWLAAEAAPVTVPATVAAALATWWLLPGARPPPAAAIAAVVVATVVVTLVVPAGGVVLSRRRRQALPARVRRMLRAAVEVAVLLLAVLGVVLTPQRGPSSVGVDPYLSLVPVLVAAAAGVVVLRLYPLPLRLAAHLAGHARSPVGFLGLARATRTTPAAVPGLLVLVAAVALGGFASAVNAGLAQARDLSAASAVGAHLRLAAAVLPAEAVDVAAAQPGVTAVATASRRGELFDLATHDRVRGVDVLVLDTAAYQQVLTALGSTYRLPDDLVTATGRQPAVPILAEGGIARRSDLVLRLSGDEHPVRVVGGLTGLPGPDGDHGWVLVPRQALPHPPPVTELIIGGAEANPAVVTAAVAAVAHGAGPLTVTSLVDVRHDLEHTGFHHGLTRLFALGAVTAAVGGVLAMLLALVVPARARGHELSLLRTMGLSTRQAPRLLLTELLPVSTTAIATGAVIGLGLPLVLSGGLHLGEFTGGAAYRPVVEPVTVPAMVAMLAVVVAVGVLVQAVTNRRRGLGRVLRVD